MTDTERPDTGADLATRVALMEARAAVTDLVHRYALFIRAGTPDRIADELFTADGAFEVRDIDPLDPSSVSVRGRHAGQAALHAYLMAGRGGLRVVPMIRNLLIDVAGDVATGSCLMSSRTWPAGAEVFGEYRDSFRREDRWRFTERVFTIYRKPAQPSGTRA